LEDDVELVFS